MNFEKFIPALLLTLLKIAIVYYFYIWLMRIAVLLLRYNSAIHYCISFFIVFSFTVLVIVWYVKKEGYRNMFTLNVTHWKISLWLLLLCISLRMFFMALFGSAVWIPQDKITVEFTLYSLWPILCAPFVEEIAFRGLLQKQLSKNLTPWLSIFITSIAFASVHYQVISKMLPAFLLGILLGVIYYRTNKLILCVIFHFLYNLSGTITQYSLKFDLLLQLVYLVLAIGLAIYSIPKLLRDTTLNKETT